MREKRPQRGLPPPRYPTIDELDGERRTVLARLAGVLLGGAVLSLSSSREKRPLPPPPAKGKKKSPRGKAPPPKKYPRPPIVDDPGFAALPEAGLDQLDG